MAKYTFKQDYPARGTNVVPEGSKMASVAVTRQFKKGEIVDADNSFYYIAAQSISGQAGGWSGAMQQIPFIVKTIGATGINGQFYGGAVKFEVPSSILELTKQKFIFTRDWSGQARSTGGMATVQVMTEFKKGEIVEGVKSGDSRSDSGTIEFSSPKTAGRFYVSDSRNSPLVEYFDNQPNPIVETGSLNKMTIKQAMPYVLGFVGIIAVLKITKVI